MSYFKINFFLILSSVNVWYVYLLKVPFDSRLPRIYLAKRISRQKKFERHWWEAFHFDQSFLSDSLLWVIIFYTEVCLFKLLSISHLSEARPTVDIEKCLFCWSMMCRRGQEPQWSNEGEGDPSTGGDGTAPDGKASWKKRCLSRDLNVKNKLAVARTIKWIQVNVKASISENVGKGESFFFFLSMGQVEKLKIKS